MAYDWTDFYNKTVVQANHFSIELSTSAKLEMLEALKKLKIKPKVVNTISTKNIHGIENLSFTQTVAFDCNGKKSVESHSYDYACDLDGELELKISGRYSNNKITIPVMFMHKQTKWGYGFEINLNLDLSELNKSGIYLVGSIPIYGTQVVIKYNYVTEDVVVLFRMPLYDGNEEDKEDAANAGCDLACVNIDFVGETSSSKVFPYDTIRFCSTYEKHRYDYLHNDTKTITESVADGISNAANAVADVAGNVVESVGNFFSSFLPSNSRQINRKV